MHIHFDHLHRHWRHIEIIYPYTRSNGNTGTKVQFALEPPATYPCAPKRVLRSLADFFDTDLQQAGKHAVPLQSGNTVRKPPLVLDEDLCLVPVKMRERKNRESTLGYLVLRQVDRLLPTQPEEGAPTPPKQNPLRYRATLCFHSGNHTETCQTLESLRKDLQRAENCRKRYYKKKLRRKLEPKAEDDKVI